MKTPEPFCAEQSSASLGRMATYLPEEVVAKILSKLPTKSLIRFKCVSKSWHGLIGNPDFISKNLLNHAIVTQNPSDPLRLILFFAREISVIGKQIHSFRSYDSLHSESQTPLTLPPAWNFIIVASCNGLLCFWDYGRIYLWNPATSSELTDLPAPSSHRRAGFVNVYTRNVGFGFDSGSNDFKVVRLLKVVPVDEDDGGWFEAEIYSLRSGSWRLLDLSMPFGICIDSRTAALDGGFLWYCDKEYEKHMGETIVAFDFSDEEFRTMLFPDARVLADYGKYTRTVTELKGSVAMLVFPVDDRKKEMHLDIWVMLEFGVSESWTRLLSIGLPLHLNRPLRFWKNGELFIKNSEGQLVLYDLLAQTETNLQFEGFGPFGGTLQVVDYRLSSVLINGGKDNP